ncbi:MAG TPA: hypothetical protein VJ981_00555 [Gammaproteobacteria bacterium]|nr:hypothetical protein [Gammaproteobacteria bacterium]
MSLLDDLKKEAQAKAQEAKNDSSVQQNTERNWHLLAPKMHVIFKYYKELVENLKLLKPDDFRSYQLTKTITFKNLKMDGFRLAKNNEGDLRSFSFRYDLVGDRDIRITFNDLPHIEKTRSILAERGFFFREITETGNRSVFVINPKFTVTFKYMVDLENCLILLKIDNFEGAWSQMVRYSPASINEELLDETAKYILAKPNRFQELSGNVVSEDMRAKLRARLMKDGKIPKGSSGSAEQSSARLDSTTTRLKGLFRKKP